MIYQERQIDIIIKGGDREENFFYSHVDDINGCFISVQ